MQFVTTVSIEIAEDLGEFQEIENKICAAMKDVGGSLLHQVLHKFEQNISADKMLTLKDRRERTIQSLAGQVRILRSRVFDRRLNEMRYPVDDWLQLKSRDPATPALRGKIISSCAERPYRKASHEINTWTGNDRSAISNWRLLQREAKLKIKKSEKVKNWCMSVLPSVQSLGADVNPCPVLAIDLDGTYCKSKGATDHDVKMAVMYTGKKLLNPNGKKKKRFALQNKTLVTSKTDETLRRFLNRVMQTAITHYGFNCESFAVVHGDGDAWIKTFQIEYLEKHASYLDPWHVLKKIRMATGVKEIPTAWQECVYGKPDELILHLKNFQLGLAEKNDIEKIDDLIGYIENNKEGLSPHNVPPEIRELSPGLFKKGSGQMESNICLGIADRFKQRRMSWSAKGLDNLSSFRTNLLNIQTQPRYNVPNTNHRSKLWDGLAFKLH